MTRGSSASSSRRRLATPTKKHVAALPPRALIPVCDSADSSIYVSLGEQDPARFRALVARDDPSPLEHVDQAARTRVADAEAPLEQARRCRLRRDDDLDRALEQRILVGVELTVVVLLLLWRRLRRLQQALVELLLALRAALLDDQRDLFLAHVGALQPLQARSAERLEEHVALAEEALGTRLVEDDARVGLARDGESDPARDVRLDHSRDHVDRRPLCRQYEVDADRPGLLRQSDDGVLHILGRDH